MNLMGRNHPKGIGIAQRTRKNLEYIKCQVDWGNEEVHVCKGRSNNGPVRRSRALRSGA